MYNLRVFVIFYFTLFNVCHGNDWHFSMSSMYELFDMEINHIKMAETYIKDEYKRLDDIRRFMEQRKKQNEKEIAEAYMESSINAFKTILRIKTDWETLRDEMAQTTKISGFKGKSLVTSDDIASGYKAIRRLQVVYELEVSSIMDGSIDGYNFEKFDINDGYKMATLCDKNSEYHGAYAWYDQIYKRYKAGDKAQATFDYTTLVTHFTWASYLVGDVDTAMGLLNTYLEEHNYQMNDIMTNIRYIVWSGKDMFKRNTANDPDKKYYSYPLKLLDSNKEVRNFKTTCQNKYPNSYLKCRYYRKGHKFLAIAPLREENVSLIPDIKLYHGVLYDSEIKKIKELAKPKLERLANDTDENISLRKVAVFDEHDDRVFDVIHKRLGLIASKSKSTRVLNKYTVTNYGLTGHYLPHEEYIDDDHLINSEGREAIVIFHLDDVPKGGATVLPDANVHVPSIKGSAMVIYNTRSLKYPNGRNIMYQRTQYGSCPILYGDKWTLTAWLGDKKNTKLT